MLLCAALWSIAGIFIKLIPWNSVVIAGVRSLIAGLVMFVYMRSRGIRYTADKRSLLGGGALCVTLTFYCNSPRRYSSSCSQPCSSKSAFPARISSPWG